VSLPLSPAAIAEAYVAACRLEVRTLKPGNVHVFAEGHGMTVADFDRSAEVSAPFLADPGPGVGVRIRRAVEATFDAVATNTNLGILLLCAPLAAAAGPRGRGTTLPERVASVLAALDHEDAREVYSAITRANPAGLGAMPDGDVRHDPPEGWTLLDAMRAAAPRDLIAAEYASGFAGLFDLARTYDADLDRGAAPEDALAVLFLRRLAQEPDTHIVRKHGREAAEAVTRRAAEVLADLALPVAADIASPRARDVLLDFDAELKGRGANPGSLADLMCATVFLATLIRTAGLPGR
jgi:triphosphoribosyl-dephospho-CoA synthase